MEKAVVCIVSSREQAVSVITALQSAGVPNEEISALFPHEEEKKGFAHELDIPEKSVGALVAGAGAGGFIGGTIGLLAGVGALAIPGIGPVVGLGPLLPLIAGALTGATFGGIGGVLVTAGVPESQAKHYEGRLREGQILLSVHTASQVTLEKAAKIFKDSGASDVLPLDKT
jgi:hypothetical protein